MVHSNHQHPRIADAGTCLTVQVKTAKAGHQQTALPLWFHLVGAPAWIVFVQRSLRQLLASALLTCHFCITKSCTVHASEIPACMPQQTMEQVTKLEVPCSNARMSRNCYNSTKCHARDQQPLTVTAFWCDGEHSTRHGMKSCLYKQGCSHQQVIHMNYQHM